MNDVKWNDEVKLDNFDAAQVYLSILLDENRARACVRYLRKNAKRGVIMRRANDILRATQREPLPNTDPGVWEAKADILAGKKLNPILIVSWSHGGDIADGYHRVSAAYNIQPFEEVACVIAHVPRFKEI